MIDLQGTLKMTTTGNAILPEAGNDGSASQGLYVTVQILWTNVSSDPKVTCPRALIDIATWQR